MKISKKLMMSSLAASVIAVGATGCSTTTDTGAIGVDRNQLLVVSDQQVQQLSKQAFQQEIAAARAKGLLDTNPAQLARLQKISQRLIAQTGAYRRGKCMSLRVMSSMRTYYPAVKLSFTQGLSIA